MASNKREEGKELDKNDAEEVDMLIKHPLHNKWTLWYYESDKKKAWSENLKEITSFDTVEDFWSLYNHIKAASELRQGSDYSLFKKGIQPMWEDEANRHGGRWLISLDKKQRENDLDSFWLEILLCMIGEAFDEYSDAVCGATVNIRARGDKIGLWTSNADKANEVSNLAIGRKIKERLKITHKNAIVYQVHSDTQSKSGSITKNTYTL